MPAAEPAQDVVKLRHLREYRVLLCVTCGYCVLPHALDRHLKCIHRLSRADRSPYVDAALKLKLANFDEVTYPEPESAPLSGLPTNKGFECCVKDCHHLCQTGKRMQAHWRTEHPTLSRGKGVEALRCRKVTIQSFFRGSSLRYFIVDGNVTESRSVASNHAVVSRLGGLLTPPPCDNVNETATDWLLIRQFGESSFPAMLPTTSTQSSWRDEMVHTCTTTDALRYATLSVTASHIAYQYPQSRRLYSLEAAKYRQKAIALFTTSSPVVTEQTFFVHWNFQRLMTMGCISRRQHDDIEGRSNFSPTESVLPEWVRIQRHGRAAVYPHGGPGLVASAMHARNVPRICFQEQLKYESNPFDDRLCNLEIALSALTKTHVDPCCLEALGQLRKNWSISCTSPEMFSFRDMALMFTARAPEPFIQLLQDNAPVAMVIFAHLCVLWHLAEPSYWYMRGQAASMLYKISLCLGWEWQAWIQWPIEMVLGTALTDLGRDATIAIR